MELLTGSPPYFDLQPMPALFAIVRDQRPPIPAGKCLVHPYLYRLISMYFDVFAALEWRFHHRGVHVVLHVVLHVVFHVVFLQSDIGGKVVK